jgi:hypothetical protein
MLEKASEIVACIRSELDKLDQGFKLRMIDGRSVDTPPTSVNNRAFPVSPFSPDVSCSVSCLVSAREFLHGCSYVPQEQPDRFTIDLIHATLQVTLHNISIISHVYKVQGGHEWTMRRQADSQQTSDVSCVCMAGGCVLLCVQDGRGYVEGLTKEVVDAAIVQLSQGLLDPQAVRPPSPPTPTPAAGM